MSNIIEASDFFKFFLEGCIQGFSLLIKGIFDIGYPLNLLLLVLIVGTPVAAYIKSR